MGMVPLEGTFYRFRGAIAFDPRDTGRCTADLTAETASLAFGSDTVQEEVLSATFLDAAAFPILAYRGACAGGAIRGALTLHGETHPLTLALKTDGGRLVASGTLDRTLWGITGRRFTVSSSVDIEVSAPLPARAPGRPTTP